MDEIDYDVVDPGSIPPDPYSPDGRRETSILVFVPVNRGPEVQLAKHAEPKEGIYHVPVEEGLEHVRRQVDVCISGTPHRQHLEYRSVATKSIQWLAAQL